MAGHAQGLANGVEEGHLHAGPQRVIPQQVEGVAADQFLRRVIVPRAPGVVDGRLSDPDNTTSEGDLEQVEHAPGAGAYLVHGGTAGVERHVDADPLDPDDRELGGLRTGGSHCELAPYPIAMRRRTVWRMPPLR